MTKYYSKSKGGFYDKEIHGDNIPLDSVEITDEQWEYLLNGQTGNSVIGSDENGMPELQPLPGLTKEQQIEAANETKARFMQSAALSISPLQDAIDLEMATDDEKKKLNELKKYRVLLNRLDTSSAPDITWPEIP